MKTKISESEAQLEVWEAKEKLYEELKNIPAGKRVDYLQKKAKNAMEKFFKNKFVVLQSPI
ncbi:MAG: hypothetical protein V1781_05035 [Bacteroidota bacterium]